MTMDGQVRIGREFFGKIKLDYNDWQFALVREFCQNCFDAPRSKNVSIMVGREGSNTRLTVANDGEPMDRDTLVGKLLTLGGSGKNFVGDNTGGFGVAKSLLYYAHLSYAIRTGPFTVTGSGAQYTITEGETYHGTFSSVLVEGDEAATLADRVQRFAACAQWRGTLTLNGKTLATDLRKGARRKEAGWGTVYTNNSYSNLCLVRLNGQPMFSAYTRYKGCVLIELTPPASNVLTSNRDALKGAYQNELSDLLTALAVDKKSALREQRAEYKRYRGERQRAEARKPKAAENGLAALGITKDLEEVFGGWPADADNDESGLAREDGEERPRPPVRVETPETANGGGGIKLVIARTEEEPDLTLSVGPEFILKNATGHKVPAAYTPGPRFSKFSRSLVRVWAALLLKLHQLSNVSGEFSVGFVFDPESPAEHEQTAVYGHVYYINPCRCGEVNGKWTMKPRWESVGDGAAEIVSEAAHEFVHGLGHREHDEDYAGKLTEVLALAMKYQHELYALFRESPRQVAADDADEDLGFNGMVWSVLFALRAGPLSEEELVAAVLKGSGSKDAKLARLAIEAQAAMGNVDYLDGLWQRTE